MIQLSLNFGRGQDHSGWCDGMPRCLSRKIHRKLGSRFGCSLGTILQSERLPCWIDRRDIAQADETDILQVSYFRAGRADGRQACCEPLSGWIAESSPARHRGEVEESVVDVGAPFPSDRQPPVLVDQGDGLFDDPPSGGDLVVGAASGDVVGDAACSEFDIHAGIVVALVRDQRRDPVPWAARPAMQRLHRGRGDRVARGGR